VAREAEPPLLHKVGTGGLVILIPRLSRAGLGGLERTRTWTWTVLGTLSAIAEHVVLAVAVVRMDSA